MMSKFDKDTDPYIEMCQKSIKDKKVIQYSEPYMLHVRSPVLHNSAGISLRILFRV